MDDNEKEKFFGLNEKEEEEESGFSESEAINENRSCPLQLLSLNSEKNFFGHSEKERGQAKLIF